MNLVLLASSGFLMFRLARQLIKKIRGARQPSTSDLIDLTECLAGALLAGERIEVALAHYQRNSSPGLKDCLLRVNTRVNLGSPIAAAIALEATGAKSDVLANIGNVVENSRALGQPTSTALQQLARELRSQYRAKEAKRVSRIAPLAGLVTALVIAPACVVVLAVLAVGGALMNIGGQI